MSVFINPEDNGYSGSKKDWIVEFNSEIAAESEMEVNVSVRPEDTSKVLIVWGKPSFEVLIVIDNYDEYNDYNINDCIEKIWAYVPKETVKKYCPEYKGV